MAQVLSIVERVYDHEPIQTPSGEFAMRDFVEYLARQLVDRPGEVDVKEVTGKRTNVYELRVGKGELGKIIGKNGQTARSIRTLLTAVSAKNNTRAVLEILE